MADLSAAPIFRIAPNSPVFDLPIHVALEHGLFDKAGVAVQFAQTYEPTISAPNPLQRQKESLFEQGTADSYNICEWAGFNRVETGHRGSRVLALRQAVAAQAILTFRKDILEPRDLADIPVGVNDLTGSHYTTLQALEGALPRDEIKTVHAGSPLDRYTALRDGRLTAAALMEPYISLALKEGAHLVAVTFYRGSQVIAPTVSEEQRTAYLTALNEAADLINADFGRYKHYIVKPVAGRLAPEELSSHFVHYTHGRTIDEQRFGTMYEWMHSWGLTEARQTYATLVS